MEIGFNFALGAIAALIAWPFILVYYMIFSLFIEGTIVVQSNFVGQAILIAFAGFVCANILKRI